LERRGDESESEGKDESEPESDGDQSESEEIGEKSSNQKIFDTLNRLSKDVASLKSNQQAKDAQSQKSAKNGKSGDNEKVLFRDCGKGDTMTQEQKTTRKALKVSKYLHI
jgi:hypothetical protein